MEENDSLVGSINDGARKRKTKGRTASNNKNLKYADSDPLALNFQSVCNHTKGTFKCNTLTLDEIVYNRKLLYEKRSKGDQNVYLVRFISPCPIVRKRPRRTSTNHENNKFSVTYFFLRDAKCLVKVCQKFFLAAFGLSKLRVNTIACKIFDGKIPTDNAEGDRKSDRSIAKKENVRKFLAGLPAKESHYNRSKSKRVYLLYELNIMLCMYYDVDLRVAETMFRRVFENDFNIGFSSPSCDICSTCELLKNKQKVEKDPEQLQSLKTQLNVHKIRAKTFFQLTKANPENSMTICFDLQQIECLSKTPIQESFYLRQLGLYAFCVTDMPTKNPHFYIWTEDQARKGSTEIASALLSYLTSNDFSDVEVLRLFADGCGGQNKNSHVVHMLIYWLKNCAPSNITKIILTFPVRGHSFLPADRVFGRVEKDLRKKPFILNPETYIEIYKNHGKVNKLAEDWNLFDIKQLETYYKKVENIRDAKKIIIERQTCIPEAQTSLLTRGRTTAPIRGRTRPGGRGSGRGRGKGRGGSNVVTDGRDQGPALTYVHCGVKMSNFYNSSENDLQAVSLLKQSINHPSLLRRIPTGNDIKQQKKKDVLQILTKQFGDKWSDNAELEWFKEILREPAEPVPHNNDDDGDDTGVHDDDDDDGDDTGVHDDEQCDCCEADLQNFV